MRDLVFDQSVGRSIRGRRRAIDAGAGAALAHRPPGCGAGAEPVRSRTSPGDARPELPANGALFLVL